MAEIALALAATFIVLLAIVAAVTPVVDRHRRRTLRRCVADVCQVLNAHGVDYWCDFGTLLGYHREGDVILSDKDADLCAMADDKPRILGLAGAFKAKGYTVTDKGGASRRVLRVLDDRTMYYVDIYPYVREGAMLRSTLIATEDVPERLVTPRRKVPFLGAQVSVPEDVPALLLHRYGPTYMTPRRGDKGATRPFSLLRARYEDLEDNCVGLYSLLKANVLRRAG